MLTIIKNAVLQLFVRSFGICVFSCVIWTAATDLNPICGTPNCRTLGSLYTKQLSKEAKPCNDFYNYVCHEWKANNPRPTYADFWAMSSVMEQNSFQAMKKLLEDKSVSRVTEYEEAKGVFKACQKLPFMERLDASIIKNIMMNIGKWPMFFPTNKQLPAAVKWWLIDNEYVKRTGKSALFTINVGVDPEKHFHFVTKMYKLDSSYGILLRLTKWSIFSNEKKHYMNYLKLLIQKVGPRDLSTIKNTIDKDLNDVLEFRQHLTEIIYDTQDHLELMSIMKFQALYSLNTTLESTANVDWLEKVCSIYKNCTDLSGTRISAKSKVQVDMKYFTALAGLLAKTSKRVIVNHIHLYFAERHVLPTEEMLDQLRFLTNADIFTDDRIRYGMPRWMWCIVNHDMKKTLAQMYIKTYFPPSKKLEVEKMINDAKNLLRLEIINSKWLSLDAKLWMANKVQSIAYTIGSLQSYKEHEIETIYDVDPLELDSFYARKENHLYMSAFNLQPPIYNPDYPYAVNYGNVMGLIFHELYHSLDSTAINMYSKSNVTGLWSNVNITSEYLKKSNLYGRVIDNFKKQEIKKHNLGILTRFVLPKTRDEDLSDFYSLYLAYKAFKNREQVEKGVCPVLPGFEEMGCEKLFFISFVNVFCSSGLSIAEKRIFLNDEHSPPRVRVNAAVASIKDFSRVFNCKPQDPLYTRETFSIW